MISRSPLVLVIVVAHSLLILATSKESSEPFCLGEQCEHVDLEAEELMRTEQFLELEKIHLDQGDLPVPAASTFEVRKGTSRPKQPIDDEEDVIMVNVLPLELITYHSGNLTIVVHQSSDHFAFEVNVTDGNDSYVLNMEQCDSWTREGPPWFVADNNQTSEDEARWIGQNAAIGCNEDGIEVQVEFAEDEENRARRLPET